MDVVHHALIGGAGYLLGDSRGEGLAGLAFLAGSVAPDLDVALIALGKRFYLKHHQGISHSLLLAPVYALCIGGLLILAEGGNWQWPVFGAAATGLYLHILLDWCNTFRIALFSPFSRKRYSLDAVFFIDGPAWVLTGLFYLSCLLVDVHAAIWGYSLLMGAYIVAKHILHSRLVKSLGPLCAIPGSLNPLEFYVLLRDGRELESYLYNILTGRKKRHLRFPPAAAHYLQLAGKSQVFRDLQGIARALHITEVQEDGNGITIHARDAAVRNFGGKFGETILKFDRSGRLIGEVAHI